MSTLYISSSPPTMRLRKPWGNACSHLQGFIAKCVSRVALSRVLYFQSIPAHLCTFNPSLPRELPLGDQLHLAPTEASQRSPMTNTGKRQPAILCTKMLAEVLSGWWDWICFVFSLSLCLSLSVSLSLSLSKLSNISHLGRKRAPHTWPFDIQDAFKYF